MHPTESQGQTGVIREESPKAGQDKIGLFIKLLLPPVTYSGTQRLCVLF